MVYVLTRLTHIVRGPHDQQFYKILDELTTECENLVISGYTGEGFDGPGQRLGVRVSHDLPPHLARETALDAAEKRRRTTEIMIPAGGRRLGGSAGHLEKVFTPRELAAMAAGRRVKDSLWCGSGNEEGTVKEGVQGVGGDVLGKRKAPPRELEVERLGRGKTVGVGVTAVAASGRLVKQEAWGEWSCPSCTLVNRGMALQCECCLERRPEPEDGFGFEEKVEAVVDVGVGLEWKCPRCTLMNGRDIIMCIACEFLRDE
ncbi:hypothetical protein BC936DRAFT_145120 [Jimgerdemannia flammicorona]|uniref:RanBP2-type domain-containing protein n=1 Tax=Jimgerdemannia flammicorona TaxID=994334 RepID=A0A433DAW7_9FUNG|nr:hypothetical protein BC936DRAFT_145120 [Jimgerdemannia flammicorona]